MEKEIANLSQSYNNPLESVIRNHVAEIARTVLRKEHGEAIKARLSAALAQKLSDDFIDRICEKAAERY